MRPRRHPPRNDALRRITTTRRALEKELVRRGHVRSIDEARALIEAGRVRVGGAVATNPQRQVAAGEPIIIEADAPRFVSRAGFKLDGALSHFQIDPRGRWALDAGSSTGGFTDCLLAHGATAVVAVDVGKNQLHERIRDDDRVDVREQTDVRDVKRNELDSRIDLVTSDLSFVSLVPLAAHLVSLAGSGGELILLVKPQFEATRREADKGSGVIWDPAIHTRVVDNVSRAVRDAGADIMGVMQSVLPGASGNIEFFVHARQGAS